MLTRFSKSPLLNLQKRVLTRTFIATPAVKYENDRPSFNSRAKYVSSGSRYGQSDMGERRSYQARGNDNLRSVCHKCGSSDHFIRDCPEKQAVTCYRCGQDGHIARDCNEAVETERVVKCHNCGEEGHIARMCPRDRMCNNCGQPGHMAMACPEPRKPRDESMPGEERSMGRQSDDGEGRYGLRQQERRPRMDRRRDSELSNVHGGDELTMRAQARDESEVVCWHCNEKGHSSRNCPTKLADPCWNCGVEGHQSWDCPQPRKDGGQRFAAGGGGRGGYRGRGGGGGGGGRGRGGRGYGGRTSDRGWESRRGAAEGSERV